METKERSLKAKVKLLFGPYWSLSPSHFKQRQAEAGVSGAEIGQAISAGYIKNIALGHYQINI